MELNLIIKNYKFTFAIFPLSLSSLSQNPNNSIQSNPTFLQINPINPFRFTLFDATIRLTFFTVQFYVLLSVWFDLLVTVFLFLGFDFGPGGFGGGLY